MINRLLSLIAPHHCLGCSEVGSILCNCCKNNIYDERFDNCIVCGIPTRNDNLCASHNQSYSRFWCVGHREDTLKLIIDSLKFSRARAAVQDLAELLDYSLPDIPEVVLVPVPTTPRNIRIRGYDHMLLIAKELAKRRNWTVSPLLQRRNNTTQHFAKTATIRRQQAREFFEVRQTDFENKPHLVIDDIFTTGATIESACRCLKDAGVGEVWAGVIARQKTS